MHLSFIGMSGVGKSYWAKPLLALPFKLVFCQEIVLWK